MRYLLCWSNHNIAIVFTCPLSIIDILFHIVVSISHTVVHTVISISLVSSLILSFPCFYLMLEPRDRGDWSDWEYCDLVHTTLLLCQYTIFKLCKNKSSACPFVTIPPLCQFTPSTVSNLRRLIYTHKHVLVNTDSAYLFFFLHRRLIMICFLVFEKGACKTLQGIICNKLIRQLLHFF